MTVLSPTADASARRAPRRGAVSRALAPATCRSTAWRPLHLAGVVAVALAATVHRVPEPAFAELVGALRFAAVASAVGTAGALDDPTRPHLDGTPVSLAARQSLRLVVAAAATLCWWAAALVTVAAHPAARAAAREGRALPIVALTVELLALLLLAWAVAAVVVRRRGGSGAVAGAGAVVATPVLLLLTPQRWGLLAGDPGAAGAVWVAAHLRWLGGALLAATVLAFALRDPARRLTTRPGRTPR